AAEQQRFSNERADFAVQYLLKKGITKRRLFPSGLAARRSIADNRTPLGRQKNRRLEIVVVP
ncbi:MAG TPA: OmpA family protein, partial [Candidatus Kapabacteria bacterium]|nr:OmpA family protein [Candidatus Kapabacteria bacterium]